MNYIPNFLVTLHKLNVIMIQAFIFTIALATLVLVIYSLIEIICCNDYKNWKTAIRNKRRQRFYNTKNIPKRRHSEPARRRRKRKHILAK